MARKVGLSREAVLAMAMRVADERGIDAVSLAAVASALGVRSPSLYAHFDGLSALQRALGLHAAGELARGMEAARAGRRGAEALREVALAYLRFARAHPGWYAAIHRVTPVEGDTALYRTLAEIVMPIIGCLADLGVPAGEMVHQTRVVRSALHGFANLERGGGFGRPAEFDDSFERLVRLLLAGARAT